MVPRHFFKVNLFQSDYEETRLLRELTDLLEGRSEENSARVDEIIHYLQEKDSEKDIRIKSCKLSQLCSPKEIFLVAYGCLNTIKLNHSKRGESHASRRNH